MTDIAFVLCAGLGERLRPMTLATPKPLMPIWNRPLLAHTLDRLEQWGVREVYLNTHWLAEQVEAFVATYRGPLTLHTFHESKVLGTGGALRALAPHLKGRPFWLVNGDVVFDMDPAPVVEAFKASGNFAAAWLEPKRGPRTVEMDYASRVTCWASPTPKVEHTFTFTGVSLLSPEVLDFLPSEKLVCSVVEAFNAAMYAGKFVHGVSVPRAYWNDIGTPEAYVKAHADMQKTPALASYCAHATCAPDPAVSEALTHLKWSLAETIVIPLGRRGSLRSFWRLVNGNKAVIAIAYETEGRPENGRYAACARVLAKAGVPVPRIVLDAPHMLILEDLGDATLDKFLARIQEDYRCTCGHVHEHAHHSPLIGHVMEVLATFHRVNVGDLPLEPPFDEALYDWECALYETHAGALPPEAKAEWQKVKATLLAEPLVPVHRDFQSTNILLRKGSPVLIDFQGMRLGAALYDVASFLYDPYVDWGEAVVEDAVAAYATAAHLPLEHLKRTLPYAGIQRLMQAIGAYYRLNSVGQPRFLAYVPIARERASTLAHAVGLHALAYALTPSAAAQP